MRKFLPEGNLINTEYNKKNVSDIFSLKKAFEDDKIIEARAILCDREHNLHIDFGFIHGIIYRNDTAFGIDTGATKDIAIISRVNKPVCFKIIRFETDDNGIEFVVLSRKKVQEECFNEYVSTLKCGDIIEAKIAHIENFGAFVDIGAGINALLPIDNISVSRIPNPSVHFNVGQTIKAIIKSRDSAGRITLSHKELLGTWEQNAQLFHVGETVPGIIRSVEKYGIFVEITPNLSGLAELVPNISPGQTASVYIKNIIPEKMKIKLIIVESFDSDIYKSSFRYFTDCSHIDKWIYSPANYPKIIESVFE